MWRDHRCHFMKLTMDMASPLQRIRVALLLVFVTQVTSKSSSSYYPSDLGMYDPNLKTKMYWANAADLINDLSEFDALYVTHHNCAWSSYEEGCGADIDDDELWYMGLAPCFRANAAFSLYGILKGERDRGCTRKTFINSFMTSNGVEAFTTAMVDAGRTFTTAYNSGNGYPGGVASSCSVISEQNQNNNGGAMLNDYYDSYGISCLESGKYVSSFFKGAFCSDDEVIGTKDGLDTFNNEISKIQCVPIYQAGNQRKRKLGDSADNEDDGDDSIQSPLSLLLSSHTCSVAEYPRSCPDPFGMVRTYEKALALTTGQKHNKRKERIRLALSWIMLLVGVAALAVPVILARRRRLKRKQGVTSSDEDKTIKKRTLWQRLLSVVRKKQRASGGNTTSGRNSTTSSMTD